MGQRGPLASVSALPGSGKTKGGRKPPAHLRADPVAPEPPEWLDAEAQAEWRRVAGELDRIGVISRLDRGILAAHCRAWSQYVDATLALDGAKRLAHERVNAAEDRLAAARSLSKPKLVEEAATELATARTIAASAGLVVESYRGGFAKHPLLQVQRDFHALLLSSAKELLVSPNARMRATLPDGSGGDDDEGIFDS